MDRRCRRGIEPSFVPPPVARLGLLLALPFLIALAVQPGTSAAQPMELCNGVDDDGDGEVDEGFALGMECQVASGACLTGGTTVCTADGTGVECEAIGGVVDEEPEGPAGSPSCFDHVDNDCDGLGDLDDPSCGAAQLTATCALPLVRGERGAACAGTHQIRFEALHATSQAVVSAELLALDTTGNVLRSVPVANGDLAQLLSGLRMVNVTSHDRRHRVSAPIPMLRVRVRDGGREVEAYCSNLPFLDVVAPAGLLGTVAVQGEATTVRVAIPRVDPRSLGVALDGVDVLAELGIDPATELPGGPFAGTVMLGSDAVQVTDLVVESGGLADLSSNTLRLSIAGLGGGGHVVTVTGDAQAGALPDPGSVQPVQIRDPSGTFTLTEADLLMDQLMPEVNFTLSEDQVELLPA
ncbi:MAG: hypothetical protein AB1689_27810, partial [Thermodesulfobacteriota bacterium]